MLHDQTNTAVTGSSFAGLEFFPSSVSIVSSSTSLIITNPNPTPTAYTSSSPQYELFNFGTVTNNDTTNATQSLTIQYVELVTNYSYLTNGKTLSAYATGIYTNNQSSASSVTSNTLSVHIVEPHISITKTIVSPTITHPGQGDELYVTPSVCRGEVLYA